ncbi:MAG: NPCBM/NEW2 domain-containing protein [Verrucomicrobiales bacterium]
MHSTKLESVIYVASLFFLLLSNQSRSEFRVDIENTDGTWWGGFVKSQGTKLVKTRDHTGTPLEKSEGSAGIEKTVDLDKAGRIIFYAPPPAIASKTYEDGPLPEPWKSKVVGTLPRGGSAEVKNGSIIIETSSPETNSGADAFYTAYRPLPEDDAYITARISRIDTYEETTQSGITIHGENETGSPGVFLALSHRHPAAMIKWGGSYSGAIPRFSSDIITRETPRQWVNIDIDVSGAMQLFLVVRDGGDGSESDWANWIRPRILTTGSERKLTELHWKSATTGWGKVYKNKNTAGGEMRLGGEPVEYGIGTHANSIIEFDLPPGTTRFRATAGIDDAAPQNPSVKFMVYTAKPGSSVADIPKAHYDSRNDFNAGQWLRLVRSGGHITGYISPDGELWREILSVPDEIQSPAVAGLIARGTKPRRRWATIFDHVATGTLEQLGSMREMEPRIALVDGTIFHEKITGATPTLFHLGGSNRGRVLPTLSIARIEYYYPLDHQFETILAGREEGLILANGDFFGSKFSGIKDNTLTSRSILFGNRSFDLNGAIDALVFRPASKIPPKGLSYVLETWRGGRIYGRNLRVRKNHITIDTIRLGSQHLALNEIRNISRLQIKQHP